MAAGISSYPKTPSVSICFPYRSNALDNNTKLFTYYRHWSMYTISLKIILAIAIDKSLKITLLHRLESTRSTQKKQLLGAASLVDSVSRQLYGASVIMYVD